MDTNRIIKIINESTLLNGCEALAKLAFVREYKKGSYVYDIIDGIGYVGLIAAGEVTVLLVSNDGGETHISTLTSGGCFGVSNLLYELPLETTLRCRGNVEIIYIPKSDIVAIMKNNPDLAMRYAAHCNGKITFLLKRIEAFTVNTGIRKLAKYLLQHKGDSSVVHLNTTRNRFASYLGMSRAALYREFAILESKGVIEISGKNILIRDEQQLNDILNDKN